MQGMRWKPVVAAVAVSASIQFTSADTPDKKLVRLAGIYQVVSSSDPLFPIQNQQEWFLDFGKGITARESSGSVAVSLRQNPHVRVRIMAWQYFSDQESLAIGNPYAEGANKAVAAATWQVCGSSTTLDLRRDGFRVILRRAVAP